MNAIFGKTVHRQQVAIPQVIDDNFEDLRRQLVEVKQIVMEAVDAASAAVSVYLPAGKESKTKDFYWIKTDNSANAVTIVAQGTDTIATGFNTLSSQFDFVRLTYINGVWYPVATNL